MSNQQAGMPQHEQEMREAFEDTYRARLILDRRESGEYVFTRAITAWDAWQAATLAAEETFNQRLVELTRRIRDLESVVNEYYDLIKHINSGGDFDEFVNGRSFASLTESNFTSSLERQYKENQG